jgi:hypothetical protein
VSNVFGFLPTGELFEACINWPGSYHDSRICRDSKLYDRIRQLTYGYKIICDSAFPHKKTSSHTFFAAPRTMKSGI